AARMMDDQAYVEGLFELEALPGLPEQPRLAVGRQRRRLSDVDFRGSQPVHRGCNRVEDVARRDDEQPDGAVLALGQRDDLREQQLLCRGRSRGEVPVVVT